MSETEVLYDRLGGQAGIDKLVNRLVELHLKETLIESHVRVGAPQLFETNVPRQGASNSGWWFYPPVSDGFGVQRRIGPYIFRIGGGGANPASH